MGHLINNKIFVSELTPAEVKECRKRAFWLAERHFSSKKLEAFDLGNFYGGYMTAEVTTSYVPGQRRLCVYVGTELVYAQRIEAGQRGRRQAEDYYSVQLERERVKEAQRRALKRAEKVTL